MENFLDRFKEIKTSDDMEKFMYTFRGFHDSILKEIHVLNSGYVDENLAMNFGGFQVRIIIQTQYSEKTTAEIILSDVLEMKIDDPHDIYGARGAVRELKLNGERYLELGFDTNKFKARRVFWREVEDGLGKNSRFGEDFNVSSFHEYKELEDGWVICQECCEAWKPEGEVIMCPKCFVNEN